MRFEPSNQNARITSPFHPSLSSRDFKRNRKRSKTGLPFSQNTIQVCNWSHGGRKITNNIFIPHAVTCNIHLALKMKKITRKISLYA